jgi:putative transposase
MKYRSGSHSKYRLMYHLVWIPKYRNIILIGEVKDRLEELFRQCSDINGWTLEELNIQADHVHMLVGLKPSISVSAAVHLLKGVSSKIIRQEFPKLEEFLWGTSFWADGYFAETVEVVTEARIRSYIQNQ